ncbi:MAG TPA: PAS domain S-box protein, partial [Chroococcidiopsis sp.]
MQPSPQSTVSGLSGVSDSSGVSESRGGSELERVLEQLMAIALQLQQPTDWATRLAGAVEGVSALLQGGATTIYRIHPEQRATQTATKLTQSKNLDSLEGAIAPCLASGIPSGLASDLASPQMLDLSPYWENLVQGQMVQGQKAQGQKAQDQDAVTSQGQLLGPIAATPSTKASTALLWGVLVVQRPVTSGDMAWSAAELHALRQVSLQVAIALQQSSLEHEVEQLKSQQAIDITDITAITGITGITHRQQTDEPAKPRELFLRSIYDGVAQGIVVIDVGQDGDFYYAGQNPAAERLTGIASSQIQGKTPEQAFGVERGRSIRRHYQQCVQSQGAISYEEELQVEGTTRWGFVTLSPLIDAQGQIYRVICTNQDITKRKRNDAKRKQVEQALDRSEARFQHLVSNIPGVIYRSSGDTHRTMEFISEFVEEVSGYPALDFVDDCVRSWTSIIHPDDQAAVSAELAQAIAHHQSFTLEYRICHSDGSLRWVYEQGRGVYEPEGAIACLDGVIFDISRIKQTAQRLHDSETFLHAIINGIGDPLFVKDAQHRYLLANDAMCEFLGHRREQIIGQTDFDLFSPDEAHILHHADQQVLDACTVQIQEERITDRRGMTKILSAKKSCVCDGAGQSFLIVTIRDITDLKQAEMILQHTNEVLEARVEERTIQLRRSENQLRALLSAAPIVLYAIDASGQFTLSEGKGLQAVGRSPGEWVGKSVYDVYAQSPQILEFINRGLAGEQSVALINTDGLWYENYFSPLWNEEGKVDGLIGIALDVTERMQVQQERDRFFELSVDMLCTAGI